MAQLRLGTRGSALARWQAHWVASQLAAAGLEVELIPMATSGDAIDREPIGNIGGAGVFTKELQRALLANQIDLAVHSLKDLPTDEVPGLTLAAVSERESPADVLISRRGEQFDALSAAAVIGTGSLRRRAQLLHLRGDLQMRDIRGNVDTRLEKLSAGQYDAIVLAHAGLKRLGLQDRIAHIFEVDEVLPAVGQGALGIETRTDDATALEAVARLDHQASHWAALAERTVLAALRGGCLAPIGAFARLDTNGLLRLEAVVLSVDGKQRLAACDAAPGEMARSLGQKVADDLLAQGAATLVAQSRTPV